MGLMDKLKETAQEVAVEARKATAQGKVKVEELALRRKMDERARELGYLTFRERAQGTPAGSDADALIEAMRELDDQIAHHAVEAAEPEAERSSEPGATAQGEGSPQA